MMDKLSWHRAHLNLQSNSQPVPRWGHSCCTIGNQLVFFGGYAQSIYMNDVWSFNTTTMQWTQVKTTGDIPSQRSNCTMSYDSVNDRVIVFGGGGPNKKRFNTINILNWMSKQWIQIHPKENEASPWERTYHAAQLFYPYLVVYGGEGVADMDDLWVFNFETLSWKQIQLSKTKPRPCARRFHSSAKIGNQFYVIGGCHGKYRCLSDVYSIDLTSLVETGSSQELQWKDRRPTGSSFLTRWGHTSTAYDNKIYIFGGRFSNDLNDLLAFDPESNTIKTLKTSIQLPKARRRHSACFVGSCMIIFGGFNGEYYNDLYYINVFQLKSKLIVPPSSRTKSINNMVGNKSLSDGIVLTNNNQQFYIHKGLLSGAFKNDAQMQKFLSQINEQYGKQQLQQMVSKMYNGHGYLPQKLVQKYDIVLAESQQEYEASFLQYVTQDPTKLLANFVSKKKGQTKPVVKLTDDKFSQFLDRNRQSTYKDAELVINDIYCFKTNSRMIGAVSKYFQNAFSRNYKQNKQINITLPHNNVVIFQIMHNYLLLDKVIIPEGMSYVSWIQLYELAQYFCLGRLMTVCQQEICCLVTEDICEQVLTFALSFQISTLALYCADYIIKCMVNKQDKYFYEQTTCESKNNILEMMYNLSRFDILQVKLERIKLMDEGLKRKQSESTQEEKQNYEINYNE